MRRQLAFLSLLILCACTTSRGVDLASAELVDLTHTYDAETLYWPSSPPAHFEMKELAYGRTPGGYFYSSYAICTPEHGGTHLDAPIHFAEGRRTGSDPPQPADRAGGRDRHRRENRSRCRLPADGRRCPRLGTTARSNRRRDDRPAAYGLE